MAKKKPRCTICGSKRFQRDPLTGRIVCDEGHLLQDYVVESLERDVRTAGMTTRKMRKNRKRKVKLARPTFKGDRARFLFFEGLQVMLRQQIQAIIALWHLPPELETVAKDLWAVYVSSTDLAPEPHLAQAKAQADAAASAKKTSKRQPLDHLKHGSPQPEDLEAMFRPTSDADTDELSDDSGSDSDQISQPEASTSQPKNGVGPTRARGRERGVTDPTLVTHAHYTLVICYLSCMTLRLPVFMQDILQLAHNGKIPYIHFAETLPQSMLKHMPAPVVQALLPQTVPLVYSKSRLSSFEFWVSSFIKLYASYNITFETINSPPLIARCVEQMLLPAPFYFAAKRLLAALSIDMSFLVASHQRRLPSSRRKNVQGPQVSTILRPDGLIAGAVLVSAKLHWGLDGMARHVHLEKHVIGSELPKQSAWLKALDSQRKLPKTADLTTLLSKNAVDMSDDELDAYLDYCQLTLIEEERRDGSTAPKRFPLWSMKQVDSGAAKAQTREIWRKLGSSKQRMSQSRDGLQPGDDIVISSKDQLSRVKYRAWSGVLERMAMLVGYTTEQLARLVRWMDMRLMEYEQRQQGKRKPRAEEDADADADADWVSEPEDEASAPRQEELG